MPTEAADSIIVARLWENKVVMLGDGAHGHRFYYQLVLKVLNSWISRLERMPDSAAGLSSVSPSVAIPTNNVPRKVILFLESDSIQANAANDYIATGNIDPFLKYWIDVTAKWFGNEGFTVDHIEFLSGLREVKKRIEALNQMNKGEQIDLLIRGAEGIPPYDWKDKWTKEDFDEQIGLPWFAHVRDRTIAENIGKTLKDLPAYRAFVFYGSGHLDRRELDKRPGVSATSGPPLVDYYMAHFLDDDLGRANVCVISCYPVQRGSSALGEITEYRPDPQWPDYVLRSNPIPPSPLPVLMVNSRRFLNVLLRHEIEWGDLRSDFERSMAANEVAKVALQLQRSSLILDPSCRSSLDTVLAVAKTHEAFSRGRKRGEMILSDLIARYDAIKSIEEVQKWFLPKDQFSKRFYDRMITMVLGNLPSEAVDSPRPAESLTPKEWAELKEYLLVGILEIGTQEEQQEALRDLRRRTAMDFRSPREWIDWWYGKYR
jgi:hypothetical protein